MEIESKNLNVENQINLIKEIFKTAKTLQEALNDPKKFRGLQEYLEIIFADRYLFVDEDQREGALKGDPFIISFENLDGFANKYLRGKSEDIDELMAQFVQGDPDYSKVDDMDGYEYVNTWSLPKIIKHQAEDGNVAVENRIASFLHIWKKKENSEYINSEFPEDEPGNFEDSNDVSEEGKQFLDDLEKELNKRN
jgi:hypothetical protein